ncbi:UBX domain-containing protein 11 isoform 3-T4 [Pangshura tecta]
MSSPLSSLGKHRRVPLQLQRPGKRTVPFKLSAYNEDEAELLNDILSSRTKFPVQDVSPSCSKETATKTSTHGAAPTDMELLSSMMQKIALLEQKAKSQAQEIQLKARKIAELEKQVQILQKGNDSLESSRIEELEVKCLQLQNQVWEMERFLNDYGLIWVGERNEELEELKSLKKQENVLSRGLWKPGDSTVSKNPIDFDLILENLKDLNMLAGEGVSQIERTAGGARLRQPQSIALTFYQNGIVMFNGPFRSYKEPSTQQCLQDIMDGYFPSELQTRYPDGVPFQGSDGTRSNEVILVETPSLKAVKERLKADIQDQPPAPNISTLRIKSENGEQMYIVKMLFTETIGDLRRHLDQSRGGEPQPYEIISTFPQRVYADNFMTLQECGLIPNASLLLREKLSLAKEGQGHS